MDVRYVNCFKLLLFAPLVINSKRLDCWWGLPCCWLIGDFLLAASTWQKWMLWPVASIVTAATVTVSSQQVAQRPKSCCLVLWSHLDLTLSATSPMHSYWYLSGRGSRRACWGASSASSPELGSPSAPGTSDAHSASNASERWKRHCELQGIYSRCLSIDSPSSLPLQLSLSFERL